jgi:hypothetical protein
MRREPMTSRANRVKRTCIADRAICWSDRKTRGESDGHERGEGGREGAKVIGCSAVEGGVAARRSLTRRRSRVPRDLVTDSHRRRRRIGSRSLKVVEQEAISSRYLEVTSTRRNTTYNLHKTPWSLRRIPRFQSPPANRLQWRIGTRLCHCTTIWLLQISARLPRHRVGAALHFDPPSGIYEGVLHGIGLWGAVCDSLGRRKTRREGRRA